MAIIAMNGAKLEAPNIWQILLVANVLVGCQKDFVFLAMWSLRNERALIANAKVQAATWTGLPGYSDAITRASAKFAAAGPERSSRIWQSTKIGLWSNLRTRDRFRMVLPMRGKRVSKSTWSCKALPKRDPPLIVVLGDRAEDLGEVV
jgi:hypothetical protein